MSSSLNLHAAGCTCAICWNSFNVPVHTPQQRPATQFQQQIFYAQAPQAPPPPAGHRAMSPQMKQGMNGVQYNTVQLNFAAPLRHGVNPAAGSTANQRAFYAPQSVQRPATQYYGQQYQQMATPSTGVQKPVYQRRPPQQQGVRYSVSQQAAKTPLYQQQGSLYAMPQQTGQTSAFQRAPFQQAPFQQQMVWKDTWAQGAIQPQTAQHPATQQYAGQKRKAQQVDADVRNAADQRAVQRADQRSREQQMVRASLVQQQRSTAADTAKQAVPAPTAGTAPAQSCRQKRAREEEEDDDEIVCIDSRAVRPKLEHENKENEEDDVSFVSSRSVSVERDPTVLDVTPEPAQPSEGLKSESIKGEDEKKPPASALNKKRTLWWLDTKNPVVEEATGAISAEGRHRLKRKTVYHCRPVAKSKTKTKKPNPKAIEETPENWAAHNELHSAEGRERISRELDAAKARTEADQKLQEERDAEAAVKKEAQERKKVAEEKKAAEKKKAAEAEGIQGPVDARTEEQRRQDDFVAREKARIAERQAKNAAAIAWRERQAEAKRPELERKLAARIVKEQKRDWWREKQEDEERQKRQKALDEEREERQKQREAAERKKAELDDLLEGPVPDEDEAWLVGACGGDTEEGTQKHQI